MLTRRILMLAAWTVACSMLPQLAGLDAVVRPAINLVPDKPITIPHVQPVPLPTPPNGPVKRANVAFANRYDDGIVFRQEAVITSHRIGNQTAANVSNWRSGWFPGKLLFAPVRWWRVRHGRR